jgi:hypothetical protein
MMHGVTSGENSSQDVFVNDIYFSKEQKYTGNGHLVVVFVFALMDQDGVMI